MENQNGKEVSVKMNNFNLTIPYDLSFETHFTLTVGGEVSGQQFDKASLLKQLKDHVFKFIPSTLHYKVQSSRLVIHEHINSFAIKLFIDDVEFYFIADSREVNGLFGDSIVYHIVCCDKATFEKHNKLMGLQIEQYNKEVEILAKKKQQDLDVQNEYNESLRQQKLEELYMIHYNADNSINYNKTTIQALEKANLI